MLWRLRARLSYFLARRLFHWPWLVRQPRAWAWMEGQFARMSALNDVVAQSFYGHLLLFRGRGFGAREEGIRLLGLAAKAGDAKAAYQLGVLSLAGDARAAPDGLAAAHWWALAASAGHPLAAQHLAELYRQGGHGLIANAEQAALYAQRAAELGL
ncbi:MAG: sel1 repeat family protein [Pseudomonas sp.]